MWFGRWVGLWKGFLQQSGYPLGCVYGAQSTTLSWCNDMQGLCVHMSELEALDSAGSLISVALQEICLTLV